MLVHMELHVCGRSEGSEEPVDLEFQGFSSSTKMQMQSFSEIRRNKSSAVMGKLKT